MSSVFAALVCAESGERGNTTRATTISSVSAVRIENSSFKDLRSILGDTRSGLVAISADRNTRPHYARSKEEPSAAESREDFRINRSVWKAVARLQPRTTPARLSRVAPPT